MANKNIECEIRSFVSEAQYKKLISFFKRSATFLGADEQVTYYFDCKEDLRIQKNDTFAKIWMKKGAIHDEHREEIEVKFPREDFGKLEKLFLGLGYNVEIKWFRKRHSFLWEGIDVAIDFTKGYGYIIELEKMSLPKDQEKTVAMLKEKLAELNIPLTQKEDFAKKYEFYKKNWRRLVK
jgi:predicted adenylyl cyclase CyaB